MPYQSKSQAAYFNANKAKMEKQGVNVDEWNSASKGSISNLPEHVKKKIAQRATSNGNSKGM